MARSEKEQRSQYERDPFAKEEEEKEEYLSGKKMKEILQELERAPKLNGEWIKGEVHKLGTQAPPSTQSIPEKKLLKIEEAPVQMVADLFRKKLDLDNNEYIKSMPAQVAQEMKKELLDMLIKRRSAFSAGEEDGNFQEQLPLVFLPARSTREIQRYHFL